MCGHPEIFHLRLIPIPTQLDRKDLRLTVDMGEEWDHIQEIFDTLGAKCLDWQHVNRLLDGHPRMLARMAALRLKPTV